MMINEMSEKECRTVLTRSSIGRLGCALENQPYVVPIYFAYESECVYVLSTFGQKVEWMRANPKVCIQVDEIAKRVPMGERNCQWHLRGIARAAIFDRACACAEPIAEATPLVAERAGRTTDNIKRRLDRTTLLSHPHCFNDWTSRNG